MWVRTSAIVLASILVPLVAVIHVASAVVTSQEILIAGAETNQLSPVIEISGNMVVWEDYRNGNADIYAFNLSVGAELQITSDLGIQRKPAISSNIIVWEDNRNGNMDIYAYDLSSQQTIQITSDVNIQRKPEVSGSSVVWEDDRNGSWDIYRYDLVTQQEIPVATGPADQKRPEVSGNLIVWENGNGDIDGVNLETGQSFVVTNDAGWQDMPAISGVTVIWRDGRNGNYDIFGSNLSTGAGFQLTADPTDQVAPALSEWSSSISGLVATWTDMRNGEADIFGKDLVTGEEFAVTVGAGHDDMSAISGNVVVWERQRVADPGFGSYDIYGAMLVDADVPTVSANLISGIFASAQEVTLTASEPAIIYYTTDGSAPTTASSIYSGPIAIDQEESTTLNFLAVDRSKNASAVMTEWYTIDRVAPSVSASPAGGTFGGSQQVTLSAVDATATSIYFTTDGSDPTSSSSLVSAPVQINTDTTLKFLAIDAAGNESNTVTEIYTIDQSAPAITASPTGGAYTSAQSITLAGNEEATIYYCRIDGCTPSTGSTLYTGPISITATTTLKFIGIDSFLNQSEVFSEIYTIQEVSPAPVITQAPAHVLKWAKLGTSSVPLVVNWAGTDDVAVTSYQLQRRVNGGAWLNVPLSPVTAKSKLLFLAPGKTHEFRVQARDAQGNVSGFTNGPIFNLLAAQELSPAITYTGAWTQAALNGAYGGQVKFATTATARASFSFEGTSVSWISTKAKFRGKAEVWLDGVKVATVDLYAPSFQTRMPVFMRNNLAAGSHTLEIRVLGTKRPAAAATRVDIDAFIVMN